MSKLNVATVAIDSVWQDPEINLKKIETSVKQSLTLSPEAQIILFPEVSLTGYVLDESNKEIAESIDGNTVSEVKRIAKENKVALITSFIEENGTEKPYNTTFVIDENGVLLTKYRKNHLYTESAEPDVYSAGESLATFYIQDWKCGLSTCFDIRFPRLFERYKQEGVEAIFLGFNWVTGRNKPAIMDFLVKARAHENQFFMITVDRTGSDPNNSYHGISVISNPYGEDISEKEDIYSYASLDKNEIEVLGKALPLRESFKESYVFE